MGAGRGHDHRGDGPAAYGNAAFALTDTAGSYTADVAFASGEYGWVRKTTSPL